MNKDQMEFPETFEEFAKDYGFKDDKEVYTNGSDLISVFRVKQWLEHDNKLRAIETDTAYECGKHANKWIPVSDGMPEKNMACLVSVGKMNFRKIAMYSDLMGIKDHKIFYQGTVGCADFVDITEHVNAWMPLPKPYKGEADKMKEIGKAFIVREGKERLGNGEDEPAEPEQPTAVNPQFEVDYKYIICRYNEICKSLPKVTKLTENRKKAIKARLRVYSYDEIVQAFETAEQSEFLKGENDRNWNADFDWIMTDRNLPRILEGKYNSKFEKPAVQQSRKNTNLDAQYMMMAQWAQEE